MKKKYLVFLTVLLGLVTVGCFDDTVDERKRNEIEITYNVSVDSGKLDENGDVVYEEKIVTEIFLDQPIRVAVFNYSVLDIFNEVGYDKFGIKLLGLPKSNLPASLSFFNETKYKNIGTLFEENLDELLLFNPELIIIGDRTATKYEKFSKNFPKADILDVSMDYDNYLDSVTQNANNLSKIFPDAKTDITSKLLELTTEINLINAQVKAFQFEFGFNEAIKSDKLLIAKWRKTAKPSSNVKITNRLLPITKTRALESFQVLFDLGYDAKDKIETQTVEVGLKAIKPLDPIREGYEFLGWYYDISAMFVMINGESTTYYGDTGRYSYFYNLFGFQTSQNGSLPESNLESHGRPFDVELITKVNPTYIVILDRGETIGQAAGFNFLMSNSVVAKSYAYQNNNIIKLSGEAWYLTTGGFGATKQMINDIKTILS